MNASAIFITDETQWEYVKKWKGTQVEKALNFHISNKSAVIGASGGGSSIISHAYFDARSGNDNITSEFCLNNPGDFNITLWRDDFIKLDYLRDTFIDFNFTRPDDRKGRLMTFMAMSVNDFYFDDVKGIGIDTHAALAIDDKGLSTVFGSDSNPEYVYFA